MNRIPWPASVLRRGAYLLVVALMVTSVATESSASDRQSAPDDSVAQVLVLAPFPEELAARLRGYLEGSGWRPVFVDAQLDVGTSKQTRLRAAGRYGAKSGAKLVLWLEQTSARHVTLGFLDIAHHRLSWRDIPMESQATPLERSTAFETMALIISATLDQIREGTVVGKSVDVAPRSAVVTRPAARTSDHSQSFVAGKLSRSLSLGYRLVFDAPRVRQGPALGIALQWDTLWLAANAAWVVPSTVGTSSLDKQPVELRLWDAVLGVEGGYWALLPADLQLGIGGGSALLLARRKTVRTAPALVKEGPQNDVLVQLHSLLTLASPELRHSRLRLVAEAGIIVLLRRPLWELARDAPASKVALRSQWRVFQPRAGVALQWRLP